MEAWAAAKWMRTSLHWLTLVLAGPERTVRKVPEKVLGEEVHAPILLLSQVAHLQKPGLGLPHWTGLNHAPCFQPLCPLVSRGVWVGVVKIPENTGAGPHRSGFGSWLASDLLCAFVQGCL